MTGMGATFTIFLSFELLFFDFFVEQHEKRNTHNFFFSPQGPISLGLGIRRAFL